MATEPQEIRYQLEQDNYVPAGYRNPVRSVYRNPVRTECYLIFFKFHKLQLQFLTFQFKFSKFQFPFLKFFSLTNHIQCSTLRSCRNLHVAADGLPQFRHQSTLLDLTNRGYMFHYMHVNITETPIIPYTEQRYYVFGSNKASLTLVGDVVGPIFPTMPVNATSLLNLPMDCAEQNMFSFAANMYTTQYMRLISQRNYTQERESFYHMNIGYQRQLSFMKEDGSFSLFRSDWNQSSSSVWLTAFCARIFQEASFYEWENYLYIDPAVISQAVSWILRHQTPEGSFYEVTWLPDRKVNHTFQDKSDFIRHRNISLTAHVLITLKSVKDLTGGLGSEVALRAGMAVQWLENNLEVLNVTGTPFEIAITAYALQLAQSSKAEQAFIMLSTRSWSIEGITYWGREYIPKTTDKIENTKRYTLPRLPYKYDSENIETTAYALLVYAARQDPKVDSIVLWLNSQRLTDGGWASTQDSVWAFKALMEYTKNTRIRDVSSLTVTVEIAAHQALSKVLHITKENIARLQTIEVSFFFFFFFFNTIFTADSSARFLRIFFDRFLRTLAVVGTERYDECLRER